MARGSAREAWLPYLAPALGFALFLVYFFQIKGQGFVAYLVANPLVYDSEARQILEGLPRTRSFFMSPLYPGFVALGYFIGMGGRLVVLLMQGVLLAVNIHLVRVIAERAFSRWVALGASLAMALYWSFYYFAGELLPTTLCLTFFLAGLLLYIERSDEPRRGVTLAAVAGAMLVVLVYSMPALTRLGSLLGGGALAAPRGSYTGTLAFFLILLGGAAALVLISLRSGGFSRLANITASGYVLGISMLVWSGTALAAILLAVSLLVRKKGRLIYVCFFVVGIAVPMIAGLAHNYLISREIAPMTTTGGVNLFIGNNAASDGMNPFRIGDANRERIEADKLGLEGTRRSAYFRDLALDFMREHPSAWLKLIAKKLLVSLSRVEINNNGDISERREAWKWLFVPVLHFGIIFPLAMASLAFPSVIRKQGGVLILAYLGFLGVCVVFFAAERFRLPGIACLVPLAACGVKELIENLKHGDRRQVWLFAVVLLGAALVSNIDFLNLAGTEFASIKVNRAHVLRLSGDLDEARAIALAVTVSDPEDAAAYFQLGAIEEERGRTVEAFAYFMDTLERDPFYYAAYVRALRILEGLRIDESYLDAFVRQVIDEGEAIRIRQQLTGFVEDRSR